MGREAHLEGWVGSGGPSGRPEGVGWPFRRDREALMVGREGLGGPIRGTGRVRRPSRRARASW